eukprot:9501954-Alexandrium_andersonii.AAC.1
MSASLVGSEMCIRDSSLSWGGRALPKTPKEKCPQRHAQEPRLGGGLGGPVSYTHLTLPTICSV